MKILGPVLSILFLLFSALPVQAQPASACVYYFYGEGCPHCANVEPFLEDLEDKYPDIGVRSFEIYYNQENTDLFRKLLEEFEVPQPWGVPAVFIGDKYFIGDTPIIANLEDELLANPTAACPSESGSAPPSEPAQEGLKAPALATIIGAALVDSINPCAIAVLLILFSALILAGERRRVLSAGLAFIAAVYLAYFLFGLGIFSVIQFSGWAEIVYRLVGILAIIIGLLNLKDYFWYGAGGFVMEIPRRWRHTLKDLLYKATSPLPAFFIGFLVVLFELPCTGGPYFFVLGLLAQKLSPGAAVPYLLLYNIFFVAPLLVLTALIYWGFSTVDKAAEWKERNTRLLHLITGVVLIILGVLVTFRLV